ncbi:MAG: RNA pseudouridine synthase [Saprospiraceae bacterium]|nr:RNA pseudouridine synthase [Saprospiraceae bacterium]
MEHPVPDFRIGDLVLYKNNQLVAFNKPAGIPVQDDTTGDKSLLALGSIYTQSKLQVIHRLDRPASGVVLFSKTQNALVALNEQFRSRQIRKTYLAVVQEMPPAPEGELKHFVGKKSTANRSSAEATEDPDLKEAVLSYRLLGSSDRYHLLEINLITGRHHQVRAQLAAIGCPIKGDVKYGARRGNRDRSIHLHAWKLAFTHPVSGEAVELTAPPPAGDPVWEAFAPLLEKH